jgi:putative ABC transport system substrate-binding protein
MRRIGVLTPFPENDPLSQAIVTAFAQALGRLGWNTGGNIQIDYRFAAGDPALFKTYAAELIGLSPDAILASTPQAVAAVRQQTRTIPIVFVLVIDPVGPGFVQSIARPGGSITGFSAYDPPVMGKWLQLLKEVAPKVTRVAVIFNPDTTAYTLFNAAKSRASSESGLGHWRSSPHIPGSRTKLPSGSSPREREGRQNGLGRRPVVKAASGR